MTMREAYKELARIAGMKGITAYEAKYTLSTFNNGLNCSLYVAGLSNSFFSAATWEEAMDSLHYEIAGGASPRQALPDEEESDGSARG